ncbi:hypothetical protein pb186bvf_000560 [Paramecium bursaria]
MVQNEHLYQHQPIFVDPNFMNLQTILLYFLKGAKIHSISIILMLLLFQQIIIHQPLIFYIVHPKIQGRNSQMQFINLWQITNIF